MKPPPPPQFRDRGSSGRHQRSGSLLIAGNLDQVRRPPQAPSNELAFTRREECRKCPATVWATYYFVDGIDSGWGVLPIDRCQRPDRCGDKVIGIDDDDLALVWCPVAGAA